MRGYIRNFAFAAILITVFFVSAAQASGQARANQVERVQDKNGLLQAKAGLADDREDLDRLSDLILRWNELRAGGAGADEIEGILGEIRTELRRDIAETAVQARQAGAETKRSARELGGDRREVRRERRQVKKAERSGDKQRERRERHQLRDSRRDRRDDRRDLNDDIHDQKEAEKILARKREIASELIELQRVLDVAADESGKTGGRLSIEERQASLFEDYLELSRREIEAGIREVREDRREMREDRRERREDRRRR